MKLLVLFACLYSMSCYAQIELEEIQSRHDNVMDTVVAIKTNFNSIAKFPDMPDQHSGSGTLTCTKDAFFTEKGNYIESWTQKHRFEYSKLSDTLIVYDNNFGVGNYYWDSFHIHNLKEADTVILESDYYCFIFTEVDEDYIVGTRVYWMNTQTYQIDAFEIYTGYFGIGESIILSNCIYNPTLETYFNERPDKIILTQYPNAFILNNTWDNPYTAK